MLFPTVYGENLFDDLDNMFGLTSYEGEADAIRFLARTLPVL